MFNTFEKPNNGDRIPVKLIPAKKISNKKQSSAVMICDGMWNYCNKMQFAEISSIAATSVCLTAATDTQFALSRATSLTSRIEFFQNKSQPVKILMPSFRQMHTKMSKGI